MKDDAENPKKQPEKSETVFELKKKKTPIKMEETQRPTKLAELIKFKRLNSSNESGRLRPMLAQCFLSKLKIFIFFS